MTKELKEKVAEMYFKDYSHRDIMAKLNISRNQLQHYITTLIMDSISSKQKIKEQRIEKAFAMEKNIFDRLEQGKTIKGYDSIFCSFCA